MFFTQCHQSGHLVFCQLDFLATEGHGLRGEVADLERQVTHERESGIHEVGRQGAGAHVITPGSVFRGWRGLIYIHISGYMNIYLDPGPVKADDPIATGSGWWPTALPA